MPALFTLPLIAVDIGNSRSKLGLFEAFPADTALPWPVTTLTLSGPDWPVEELLAWLKALVPETPWQIASVNRPGLQRLTEFLGKHRPTTPWRALAHDDLPIHIALKEPQSVGLDRLAGAVGANRLKRSDQPAIVVDLGSATTIDVVSADGAFLGGAILPGMSMAARALHDLTDALPLIAPDDSAQPPALGISTSGAIRSGLYWGAIGAIKELVKQLSRDMTPPPRLLLTGGGAESVVGHLGVDALHVPHLVLQGIALASAAERP